jgi:hypothetical protein
VAQGDSASRLTRKCVSPSDFAASRIQWLRSRTALADRSDKAAAIGSESVVFELPTTGLGKVIVREDVTGCEITGRFFCLHLNLGVIWN